MSDISARFERNLRLFGIDGQRRLRAAHVCVIGIGGLGSHVVQQLSLLGVGTISLIDHEEVSTSNRNRYIGVFDDDPIPGTLKVDAAHRLVSSIDPSIRLVRIPESIVSKAGLEAIRSSNYVFGCVDADGPRFVINDFCTAYAKPYIDLATDVVDGHFGGRVVFKSEAYGCLYCLGELDQNAVKLFLETNDEKAMRESIYGIEKSMLSDVGPSVVSVNGVIASLAVTEFMLACTQMAAAKIFINYDGLKRRVSERLVSGRADCPYCSQWNRGLEADTERYLRWERSVKRSPSSPTLD